MDVLGQIMKTLQLRSALYFHADFTAPWGMDIPEGPFAQFHMVTRGECVLNFNNKSYPLCNGDIIVFPKGSPHWIADAINSPRVNGQKIVRDIQNGKTYFKGEKVSTTLLCGHFEFKRDLNHPFIDALPSIIKLTDVHPEARTQIEEISRLIIRESCVKEPGAEITSIRLAEVLFIQLLRGFMKTDKSGFFKALLDPSINQSLQLIHAAPEKNWSVDSLAKNVGISRTNFFTRFKKLVGTTPLKYLTNWRMLKAREILSETDLPLIAVAERIGYSSDAAFIKVFKKATDYTPSAYRRKTLNY